jgi:hypothetical protein
MVHVAAAITGLLATVACLDSIEPTPRPAQISVVPSLGELVITPLASGFTWSMQVFVRNNGGRNIYVDQTYRRTEKLVDQKWELAIESPMSPSFRTVIPSQTQSLPYVVTYVNGSKSTLLEHVRGVYRVGLRVSYTPNGNELFPAESSYSLPFVVIPP